MNNIDIREVRLGKWYIPKKDSVLEQEKKNYPTIGYFDILEISEVEQGEGGIHPWRLAYEHSCRRQEELQSDYFVQEIKAFTNISEDEKQGFKKELIDVFWKKESVLLCMSMLHLQNDAVVSKVIERIDNLFAATDYLYYFSFDYSGIIIFAKNISVKVFLEKIFELNYNNSGLEKMIKDTFSLYGVDKKCLKEILNKDIQKRVCEFDRNAYEIAVNISIRDYNKYREFYEELEKSELKYGYTSKKRCISGRHDVSIVNNDANLYWMLMVQHFLEKYTSNDNSAFYAYETFVKTEEATNEYADSLMEKRGEYTKIQKKITKLYKDFCTQMEGEEYHAYRTAVKEVCNSILSIMKNGFAEDFVICMYHPFEEFLTYLNAKVKEEKGLCGLERERYSDEFERCFINFFDALNSLVNSAMHTDRQFIQSTAFSAMFYDIPPKIMAYYMALIDKMYCIMKCEDRFNYAFLMKPAFSDEINVTKISYKTELPESRILQVAINERCLYRPEAVIRRMAHEIAHYVGDGLRKRDARKRLLIQTYLYIMIRDCLHEDFEENENFKDLVEGFYEIIQQLPEFKEEGDCYIKDCRRIPHRIFSYMKKNNGFKHKLRAYFRKEIPELLKEKKYTDLIEICGIDDEAHPFCVAGVEMKNSTPKEFSSLQIDFLIEQTTANTFDKMLDIEKKYGDWQGTLCEYGILTYFNCLLQLYSEVYADMQMIMVLNYRYDAYLNAFIEDERIELEEILESNEDISRIAVITKLMQDKNLWNDKMIENATQKVKEFHEIVKNFIADMEAEDNAFYQQNKFLMEYLLLCYEQSEKHYTLQKKDLQKLQKDMQVVLEHVNIFEVYSVITTYIQDYHRRIYALGE